MESGAKPAVDFLASRNLGLRDLAGMVRPLGGSEALLLVGSVADGLAHPRSDINLLFIGDAPTPCPEDPTIRIQYCDRSHVERVVDKLSRAATLIRDPSQLEADEDTKVDILNELELGLLHGIRTGVVVENGEALRSWREHLQDLPESLVLYYLGTHFNAREDVIAQAKYGDAASALWMLSTAADLLAGALLASIGETNPDPRWRPRLLRRHREPFDQDRIERLLQHMMPADAQANTVVKVQHALSFFDVLVLDVFARRPAVVNPILELRKRATFVTRFDELTSDSMASSPQPIARRQH